uniref:ARFGEF family member 3 n=1 Tax=Molossus molossus TaxID=27622 RepID=A0A7J8GMR8_MOLMO|nr:ARFGEF family member 3 [Molossus molossus]
MEEILRKLQKEASGSKYKAIKESCTWALETLGSVDTVVKIPPHLLREKCLLPLQLALESKNVKLAQHALAGIQKLLSEERFVSMETDSDEKQLLNQILNAVKVTPSLNEDLQVEVMKVLLCITYTPTFDLSGSAVLKIAEVSARCPPPHAACSGCLLRLPYPSWHRYWGGAELSSGASASLIATVGDFH